jgi:hypothetical protein
MQQIEREINKIKNCLITFFARVHPSPMINTKTWMLDAFVFEKKTISKQ